jgi:tetratricopeptide (TPR) repeat protein
MIPKINLLILIPIILIACSPSEERLMQEGRKEMETESYDEAIKHLDKAISINSTNLVAINMRGVAYYQKQEYAKAIEDFSEYIKLDSSNYMPYYNRGNAYLFNQNYQKSLIDYNRAIKLRPNIADLYINRGTVLFELKQFRAAIEDNNFAIKVSPNNYIPYLNNAKTYIQLGVFDEAKEFLINANQLSGENGEVYYWKGFIEINTGNAELGCSELVKAKNRGFKDASDAISKFCE